MVRFEAMSASHCYYGMEYAEDRAKIAEWAPLIMDGRGDEEPFAATRIITGTDVDYGALTHLLVKHLSAQPGVSVRYKHRVVDLDREPNGAWRVASRTLDRNLEEDLAYHPDGIRDHGEELGQIHALHLVLLGIDVACDGFAVFTDDRD